MLDQERRRAILELLSVEGRVLTAELSLRLRTSQVTIRKDLDLLHRERRLHRAHGGALPLGNFADKPPSPEIHLTDDVMVQGLAAAAVGRVTESQVVVLDSGAISIAIARGLYKLRNLTVVTNSMNIAAELAGSPIQVILAGGKLCSQSCSFVGPIAEDMLHELSADLLFLEMDGLDLSFGASARTLAKAQVNRAMIDISRRVVAVCDSSKLGRRSSALIAPAIAIHQIVTDHEISPTELRLFQEAGIEVTLV